MSAANWMVVDTGLRPAREHMALDMAFMAACAAGEIGKFFIDARAALPETPVLLGCARPSGVHRSITDTYAVMAGLNGVAFPSDGMLALAKHLDRDVLVTPSCCSMIVGEEVLALGDESTSITLDFIPEAPKRRAQLRDIPIVVTA